jgi:hypothetical protein
MGLWVWVGVKKKERGGLSLLKVSWKNNEWSWSVWSLIYPILIHLPIYPST